MNLDYLIANIKIKSSLSFITKITTDVMNVSKYRDFIGATYKNNLKCDYFNYFGLIVV